jgi:hypothetical protein
MLSFDKIHAVLIDNIELGHADLETRLQLNEAAKLSLDIFTKSPRFRLGRSDKLIERSFDLGLYDKYTEEQLEAMTEHLPFSAFTVISDTYVLFFCKGDPLDICGGPKIDWTVTWLDNPENSNDWIFLGPFGSGVDEKNYHGHWLNNVLTQDYPEHIDTALNKARTIVQLLFVVGHTKILVETPKKLQIKRAKRGKVPLYEYYVLPIDVTTINRIPMKQRYKILDRAACRTHFRRGHWRFRLGHFEKVRSAIVGLKNQHTRGRITKDYDIH